MSNLIFEAGDGDGSVYVSLFCGPNGKRRLQVEVVAKPGGRGAIATISNLDATTLRDALDRNIIDERPVVLHPHNIQATITEALREYRTTFTPNETDAAIDSIAKTIAARVIACGEEPDHEG